MTEFKQTYAAKDGQIFDSFLGAKEWDAKTELKNWLKEPLSPGETLYHAILEHRNSLAEILNNLVKYSP